MFAKEGAAAKAVGTRPLTSTREELASIFAEAVEPLVGAFSAANEKRDEVLGKAIALFKEDTQRNRDAIVEEKLAERMAVEKKKNVEVEKKRTKELQNKISDLELELKKAKKDVDKISDLELELKKAKGRGEGDRQA